MSPPVAIIALPKPKVPAVAAAEAAACPVVNATPPSNTENAVPNAASKYAWNAWWKYTV